MSDSGDRQQGGGERGEHWRVRESTLLTSTSTNLYEYYGTEGKQPKKKLSHSDQMLMVAIVSKMSIEYFCCGVGGKMLLV